MNGSALRLRLVGYAVMAALGAAWSLHVRGTIVCAPSAALNGSPLLSAQLIGCGAALLFAWANVYATRMLVAHTQWARSLHLSLRAELLGLVPAQMALLAGLAALSEELLFRSALSSSLGVLPAALLFGAAHFSRGVRAWPAVLWAFAMGVSLGLLFFVSGTLLAPVLAHCLINYENMQYICNYDPTPLDMDRASFCQARTDRSGRGVRNTASGMAHDA